MNNARILSLIFILIASRDSVGDSGKVCLGSQPVQMRAGIAGSLKAQLLPGVCVVDTGEVREGWTRVTVDGWVDSASLVTRSPDVQAVAVPSAATLNLIESKVLEGSRDLMGTPSQVQVVLVLKNASANPISSWSGILAAKDLKGQFPIRMRVSGSKPVPPGGVVEERFNWSKGDPEFALLLSPEGKALEFSLNQVAAR